MEIHYICFEFYEGVRYFGETLHYVLRDSLVHNGSPDEETAFKEHFNLTLTTVYKNSIQDRGKCDYKFICPVINKL